MPYNKKWVQLLIAPFHSGQNVTDEKWEAAGFSKFVPGKITSETKAPEKVSECKGCRMYDKKKKSCVYGETKGTDRCKDLCKAPQFTSAFKAK